jgi:uncharacterized membrane protein YbjE (DUF340 family)
LLLLIFILGINIGVNDNVVSKFYKLSFQAFVIALFSIVFSIAFVKLVSGFVKQDEKESE